MPLRPEKKYIFDEFKAFGSNAPYRRPVFLTYRRLFRDSKNFPNTVVPSLVGPQSLPLDEMTMEAVSTQTKWKTYNPYRLAQVATNMSSVAQA